MNPEDERVLSPSTEWTDAETVAARYDEWMRGDGRGVYRDHRRDLLIDLNDTIRRLRDVHIVFDHVVDGDAVPPFIGSELAVMDRHVRDMIDWLDDFMAAIEACEYEDTEADT